MEETNTKNTNIKKMLVVPDVHGRSFWKTVLDYDGDIIFLGDYHDPYPFEFPDQDAQGNWINPKRFRWRTLRRFSHLHRKIRIE